MILVTGATGFVGSALVSRLLADTDKPAVAVAVRSLSGQWPLGVRPTLVGDLSASTQWHKALEGVTGIVHCAARVHVMQDGATDPLDAYRKVNVEGTLNLARQASESGVKRFVFVSSIKVNGEKTALGSPFSASDVPVPEDPYGVSKFEAEVGLREISVQTGMELAVVRPPLVYGPGVKANFAAMLRWVDRGIPLPLGSLHNRRSLVSIDNLIDLLVTCLNHPAAAGQTFLVSDGEDVSTTELLRRTAIAMGKPARLLPVPASLLQFCFTLLGKRDMAQRLCSSLQVDIAKTRHLLDWQPPLTLDQGLKKVVQGISS